MNRPAVLQALRAMVRRVSDVRLSNRDKVVLVTGGSRGLGLCLAREWARRGSNLVLLARDAAELERARAELERFGVEVLAIPCDVTDAAQVKVAIDRAVSHFGRLDVIVNNAGDIAVGPVETMTREDFMRALDTNFWGPLDVVLAALPQMRARGRGRIVMISSIGGVVAVPHLLPYTASKFALTGLSYGLRAELAKDHIVVTTVCPGLMRTGSAVNALFKGDRAREYAWFAAADAMPLLSMSAERAARKIVRAASRGAARVILTPQAKVANMAQAIAPALVDFVLARVNVLLPASRDRSRASRGYEARTKKHWFTTLGDRAARKNNEIPHAH